MFSMLQLVSQQELYDLKIHFLIETRIHIWSHIWNLEENYWFFNIDLLRTFWNY